LEEDVFDKREYTGLSSGSITKLVENMANNYVPGKEEEFGGLSPDEFERLILNDWSGPESPVLFVGDIQESRVNEVRFVKNAKILLNAAREQGGLPSSEDGNIELDTVYSLINEMDFSSANLETPCEAKDVQDETEARPLHILRVVLEVAELLERKDGPFCPTARGEELLQSGKAGELMEHLFVTYFRVFNIAYYTRGGELAEIQGLFPYSLYRLSQLEPEGEWINRKEMVGRLIPPPLKKGSDEKRLEFLTAIFTGRILDPLAKFDLLEARGFGVEGFFEMNSDYRKSNLFDEFIQFNLD